MTAAHVFVYLAPSEVLFLDAALARLIPADALGPGARETGGTRFIDGQLASAWGVHGRHYRRGPWAEGTPQQGWQSPLSPQELYRAAILETDAHCVAAHGRAFHLLDATVQDDVLHALEANVVPLACAPSRTFFALLWQNTQEGFFADPIHGGNAGKAGWRLIGFPGVAAGDYVARSAAFNLPYRVEPVGIADVRAGRVAIDAQGYPVPVARDRGPLGPL